MAALLHCLDLVESSHQELLIEVVPPVLLLMFVEDARVPRPYHVHTPQQGAVTVKVALDPLRLGVEGSQVGVDPQEPGHAQPSLPGAEEPALLVQVDFAAEVPGELCDSVNARVLVQHCRHSHPSVATEALQRGERCRLLSAQGSSRPSYGHNKSTRRFPQLLSCHIFSFSIKYSQLRSLKIINAIFLQLTTIPHPDWQIAVCQNAYQGTPRYR